MRSKWNCGGPGRRPPRPGVVAARHRPAGVAAPPPRPPASAVPPAARLLVSHHLRHASRRARHHRLARRHRLQHGARKRVFPREERKAVAGGQQRRHILPRAQEAHTPCRPFASISRANVSRSRPSPAIASTNSWPAARSSPTARISSACPLLACRCPTLTTSGLSPAVSSARTRCPAAGAQHVRSRSASIGIRCTRAAGIRSSRSSASRTGLETAITAAAWRTKQRLSGRNGPARCRCSTSGRFASRAASTAGT